MSKSAPYLQPLLRALRNPIEASAYLNAALEGFPQPQLQALASRSSMRSPSLPAISLLRSHHVPAAIGVAAAAHDLYAARLSFAVRAAVF